MLAIWAQFTQADWKLVGHRNLYQVVIIDAADKCHVPAYWSAIKAVCGNKSFCDVVFFGSDGPAISAGSLRFSEEEQQAALLNYSTNKAFVWNCSFKPEADNCFK